MKHVNYLKQIDRSIMNGQLSIVAGGYMEEFEDEAAKMFGNKYGVSTCNGTSALYLALFCLSLENKKKEVIIPAYGFHVMISVICAIGLKPVFCDVDPKTYTLDFDKCEKLINRNTLAIFVLQPWGNLADLDKLKKLKQKHNIFVISDSSHAHEARWDGKPIGKFFDINCASFGLGKLVSGGELGILTTDNPVFRDRALMFSHVNRVPDAYITDEYINIDNAVGIKFRPHLIALLLALHDLRNNKKERSRIKENILQFRKYILSKTTRISFQESFKKSDRVFWMPVLEFDPKVNIKDLIEVLVKKGIHAQNHNYKTPLNKNTILTTFYKIRSDKTFPNAESIIGKNIIQIRQTDFADVNNINIIKKVFAEYVGLYGQV